nr:RAD52 motif-containing protein 1-like [Manis javanica]
MVSVLFAVVTGNDKTLRVWELSSGTTTQVLRVQQGTTHKAIQHQASALNSSRCQELANYYFGFNRLSKRIIKIQHLSDVEGTDDEDTVAPLQKQSLKFCALDMVSPGREFRSPGVGVAEEPLDKVEAGSLSLLMKRKTIQKLAIQKAISDAFQKLLIVVLGKFFFLLSLNKYLSFNELL